MAMNKKEKEELERLATIAALRFTDPVEKDLHPPTDWKTIVNGYLYNSYCLRIDKACTSSLYHSNGEHDRTRSQQPCSLYSSILLALKAMRNEVEMECASKLCKIDKMIEEEKQKIAAQEKSTAHLTTQQSHNTQGGTAAVA